MQKLVGLTVCKRLPILAALLLSFCTNALAQSPATVTGTIQDAGGNPATSGTVVFDIQPQSSGIQYYVQGITSIVPQEVTCSIVSGALRNASNTGACTVWGNDQVSPANTTYTITFYPNGQMTNSVAQECIQGASYSLNTPRFCPVVSIVPQYNTITSPQISTNLIPSVTGQFTLGNSQAHYAALYVDSLLVGIGGSPQAGPFVSLNQATLQTMTGPLTTPTLTSSVNKVINVMAPPYNATGNGITDDTAAINSAYASLVGTGGTLYFPAGVYLTSTGIIPSQTSTACVKLEGAGSSLTTIRATAAISGVYWRPGLVSSGTANQMHCSIKGVTLDANNLALTAINNAGWPAGLYRDLVVENAVPNTTDNTNAEMIIGDNQTLGLANGQGQDYESSFEHIQILASGSTATAPQQLYIKQSVTDGTGNDIVIHGASGGSIGTPNTYLQSGMLLYGGQARTWNKVHCYPASVYAPFPTCIDDQAGFQTINNLEVDGMTLYGVKFENANSIVRDTNFVYGGSGTPAQTYTGAVGFYSSNPDENTVLGAACTTYGGAVTATWTLIGSGSQPILAWGPNSCPSSTSSWQMNNLITNSVQVTSTTLKSSGGGAITLGTFASNDVSNPLQLSLIMNPSATPTSRYFSLQSTETGVANRILAVNPNGGDVLVGTSTDCSQTLCVGGVASATALQIAGGSALSANHGTGTSLQHSDGTGTSGYVASYAADGSVTDGTKTVLAQHFKAAGTPSVVCGTGAGTSPTVCSIAGNDEAGQISVTTGSAPASAATIVTVTLANACPTSVYSVVRSSNANAAQLSGVTHAYPDNFTATTWTITSNATGLAATTAYTWAYIAKCN